MSRRNAEPWVNPADAGSKKIDPPSDSCPMCSTRTIDSLYDSICFAQGDNDAIVGPPGFQPICYNEIQYASQALGAQLLSRYRPTHVLLDLRNAAPAEAIAMLACMRICVPFVPVSAEEYHRGDRLGAVVKALQSQKRTEETARIAAVVRCDDDADPILTRFSQVNVHNVIFVNQAGDMLEPMDVPQSLPPPPSKDEQSKATNDDLYVLFTSGTSGDQPKGVVGSHKSTINRLMWFAKKFPSTENTVVARRSKLTFVDSITELFSALLFPPAVLYEFDETDLASKGVSIIFTSPCTRVTMLPSQLIQLLPSDFERKLLSTPDEERNEPLQNASPSTSTMKMVIVSGEPCPAELLSVFKKQFPSTMLVNLYGQTESTGDVTCGVLTDMEHPIVNYKTAIGFPIDGVTITSNSKNELIVSGNLSNGYLHSNTTEAPFREFATGDIGFCGDDGCWYIKGRADDVGKVNGVLTSPSEVEAAFAKVYPSSVVAAGIVDTKVCMLIERASFDSIHFSRETMREAGLPWNLIPRHVFPVPRLPKSGGAGKVDRARVKHLLEKCLASLQVSNSLRLDDGSNSSNELLSTVLTNLLGTSVPTSASDSCLRSDDIDQGEKDSSSSFVELGGDSALAVALLHQLKATGLIKSDTFLTATAILETGSRKELQELIFNDKRPNLNNKRQKRKHSNANLPAPSPPFEAKEIMRIAYNNDNNSNKRDAVAAGSDHLAVHFAACVDAAPVVFREWVYAACQGGIIQRLQGNELCGFHDLGGGWKVQAGMLITDGNNSLVIVCGYHPENDAGIIAAFSLDLAETKWKTAVTGRIKSTPVQVDGSLYVVSGQCLNVVELGYGQVTRSVEFPSRTESRPAVVSRSDSPALVYAFSDWDGGIAVVEKGGSQVTLISNNASSANNAPIGPVYADLLAVSDSDVWICDINGYLHHLDVERLEVRSSTKVTSQPIFSGPVKMKKEGGVVFGCHDGKIRCFGEPTADAHFAFSPATFQWEYDAKAVVYSKCHVTKDNDLIVCTTAGDVLQIAKDGTLKSKSAVTGEIWSNAVTFTDDQTTVIIGARDSKLHLIRMPS